MGFAFRLTVIVPATTCSSLCRSKTLSAASAILTKLSLRFRLRSTPPFTTQVNSASTARSSSGSGCNRAVMNSWANELAPSSPGFEASPRRIPAAARVRISISLPPKLERLPEDEARLLVGLVGFSELTWRAPVASPSSRDSHSATLKTSTHQRLPIFLTSKGKLSRSMRCFKAFSDLPINWANCGG